MLWMGVQHLRAAVDASPDAILFLDPATMSIVDVNETACRTLGYAREELLRIELRQIAPEVTQDRLAATVDAWMHGRGDAKTFETVHRRSDGFEFRVHWHVHAVQTEQGRAVIVFARETAPGLDSPWKEPLGSFLLTDVGHDPLTRLPNRRLFEKRLERALNVARRCRDFAFAVVFIDLDGFKAVNDHFGHFGGDRVLSEVARRLSRSVRPGDMVARLGGDEFTVLVENLGREDDAAGVGRRIHAQMEPPIDLEGHEVAITASIGIAASRRGYDRPEAILRDADRAMYFAKARGLSPYVLYDSAGTLRAERPPHTWTPHPGEPAEPGLSTPCSPR